MYTCNDIQNLANYISNSGLKLMNIQGKKNIFVPYFVEQSTSKFKKSVAISCAYLDLNIMQNLCNTHQFQVNTSIPQIVEKSIGIPSSDFMYKCYDISNRIDNITDVNYSYLSKELNIFFKEKEV